ncbi:Fur family transcriptional regulator [Thermohalobacter berrensis]|uniref:Transcriptional repressor n=1 Tax=Thermohalobacter berrensis TaxID=99594 RepID=A0A419T195_9FIRM|nr:Fur family transcriptional regulator [Thermohalobacter berrensis]RKD31245.1 transcriptional repressor [Thermohalobacter berrensis]
METLLKVLKEKGYKITPQRIAIYRVLNNTKEHPSAEIIYKKLEKEFPTMSLATIYKTLEIFKKSGLVQELNVGENSFRYDANVKDHPHIICLKCNKVDDLPENLFTHLKDEVGKVSDYKVLSKQLYFYGYCPVCKGE